MARNRVKAGSFQQETIMCACGCGASMDRYAKDNAGWYERRYLPYHHFKKTAYRSPRNDMIRAAIEAGETTVCACGCGTVIEKYYCSRGQYLERKYVHNHHCKGRPTSDKQKQITGARSKQLAQSPAFRAAIERRRTNPRWQKSIRSGKDHHWYVGVQSDYPPEWTHKLRQEVRRRDNYTCQHCHKSQGAFKKRLSIHHIDGNKLNCSIDNLITLCNSCHMRLHRTMKL